MSSKKTAQKHKSGQGAQRPSEAQLRRDRQQIGLLATAAKKAEEDHCALNSRVFDPKKLVAQVEQILEQPIVKERHGEGFISEDHKKSMIRSAKTFSAAMDELGIKVPGLLQIKQHHYIDVLRYLESHCERGWMYLRWLISHMRRVMRLIGLTGVIPRGKDHSKLMEKHGLLYGGPYQFLISNQLDWENERLDIDLVLARLSEEKRPAASLMAYFGMTALESVTWQIPATSEIDALSVPAPDGRAVREVEFSSNSEFAARQIAALDGALSLRSQKGWTTLCPPGAQSLDYSGKVCKAIAYSLGKVLSDREIKPRQLRDLLFCQVFVDHAGVSLGKVRGSSHRDVDRDRLARAWNEAKRQMGVKSGLAPMSEQKPSVGERSNEVLATRLASLGEAFRKWKVRRAWVGDFAGGKCLFVDGALVSSKRAAMMIADVAERHTLVKLRVLPLDFCAELPTGAATVSIRRIVPRHKPER